MHVFIYLFSIIYSFIHLCIYSITISTQPWKSIKCVKHNIDTYWNEIIQPRSTWTSKNEVTSTYFQVAKGFGHPWKQKHINKHHTINMSIYKNTKSMTLNENQKQTTNIHANQYRKQKLKIQTKFMETLNKLIEVWSTQKPPKIKKHLWGAMNVYKSKWEEIKTMKIDEHLCKPITIT